MLFRLYQGIHKRIPGDRAYALLIDKEARKVVLVQNWLNDGRWTFPGGGAKRNEAPQRACRREVKEEINLTLQVSRLDLIHVVTLPNSQRRLVFYRYFTSQCQLRYRWLELIDAQWCTWTDNQMISKLPPESRAALQKALADLH